MKTRRQKTGVEQQEQNKNLGKGNILPQANESINGVVVIFLIEAISVSHETGMIPNQKQMKKLIKDYCKQVHNIQLDKRQFQLLKQAPFWNETLSKIELVNRKQPYDYETYIKQLCKRGILQQQQQQQPNHIKHGSNELFSSPEREPTINDWSIHSFLIGTPNPDQSPYTSQRRNMFNRGIYYN